MNTDHILTSQEVQDALQQKPLLSHRTSVTCCEIRQSIQEITAFKRIKGQHGILVFQTQSENSVQRNSKPTIFMCKKLILLIQPTVVDNPVDAGKFVVKIVTGSFALKLPPAASRVISTSPQWSYFFQVLHKMKKNCRW